MVTRIPLETIERAFFSDPTDEFACIASPDFPDALEMNDYTVIRLGDKPIPRQDPPPPYPKSSMGPIYPQIPGTYYSLKLPLPRQAEYCPPPRVKPRKVNPKLLSESQKVMYGKEPFEQDLVVIAKRRARIAAAQAPLPSAAGARRARGSKIFEREYAEHRTAVETLTADATAAAENEEKRAAREKANYERERQRLKEEIARRDAERAAAVQADLALKEELNQERMREGRVLPPSPTRASALKDEVCRRMLEHRSVEDRREALNEELRRSREAGHTKKLQDVLLRMGPLGRGKKNAEKARVEMKTAQRSWKRRIRLLDKTLDLGMTLLERIGDDAAVPEGMEIPDPSPDAIIT
jgi:hypothetical protein